MLAEEYHCNLTAHFGNEIDNASHRLILMACGAVGTLACLFTYSMEWIKIGAGRCVTESSSYAMQTVPRLFDVQGVGLRPLDCWDRGLESRWGHGFSSVGLLFVVKVAAFGMRWLLVRKSPTECGCVCVSNCVVYVCVFLFVYGLETSTTGGLCPSLAVGPQKKK